MPRIPLCFAITTLVAAFVATTPAAAATYHLTASGSGDFPTIQAALDAAQDGDIIELADGVYRWSGNRDLEFYDDVILRSTGGPEHCIIQCDGSADCPHRAFVFTEESGGTIEGLTIRGGWASDGGAAFSTYGNHVVHGCRFEDNHATGRGGAWHAEDGSLVTFASCVFASNTADQQGGAVSATGFAAIDLQRSTLVRNGAPAGGGLYLDVEASLDATRSLVAWNRDGGAIAHDYAGPLDIACSNLYGNRGGDWTGGFGAPGSDGNLCADPRLDDPMATPAAVGLTLSSPCRLSNNGCGTMGAGELLDHDVATYGVAADCGGLVETIQDAIDLLQAPAVVRLEDGVYADDGNRDLDSLGKSFAVDSRHGVAADCRLSAGGVLWSPHRHLSMTGSGSRVEFVGLTLENGWADEDGGSLVALAGDTLVLSQCMVRHNHSQYSGGAIQLDRAALIIQDSSLENCDALEHGGAIHALQSSLRIDETFLDSNTAAIGGAIHADAPADGSLITNSEVLNCVGGGVNLESQAGVLTFDTCRFFDNENGLMGGAVCSRFGEDGVDLVFIACTFNGNHSQLSGGALYSQDRVGVISTSFLHNTAVLNGGAIEVNGADCVLTDVEFHANSAGEGGGAGFFAGNLLAAGLLCVDNEAGGNCGALSVGHAVDAIRNSRFLSNQAGGSVGALLVKEGDVADCIFWDNQAASRGAALRCGSGVTVTGCTIAGNRVATPDEESAQIDHHRLYDGYFPLPLVGVVLERCIVAHGSGTAAVAGIRDLVYGEDTDPQATCCAFWDNPGGLGDLDVIEGIDDQVINPLFCGIDEGDLTLASTSPCLPAASACGELIGTLGQGCEAAVGVEGGLPSVSARLLGNHPNPFNPTTAVEFELAHAGHVSLEVVDLKGRRVAVLVDGGQAAGRHEVTWHGKDDRGEAVASGVYLLRMHALGIGQVRPMALIR